MPIRFARHRGVAAALVAVLATGACASIPRAPSSATPSAAVQSGSSQWAQYFWQPGRTSCFLTVEAPHKVDGRLVSARSVGSAKIATSFAADDGMSYVIARTDRTTVSTRGSRPRVSTQSTRVLYTITGSGAVDIAPQTNQVNRTSIKYTDSYHYPIVTDANFGEAVDETVHARATSTVQATADSIADVTTDGTPEFSFVATYRYRLIKATRPVVTPAGTFTDVIGLASSLERIRVLNVSEPAWVKRFEASYRSTALPSTIWYARGVGPVMDTKTGAGGSVEKLISCPAQHQ